MSWYGKGMMSKLEQDLWEKRIMTNQNRIFEKKDNFKIRIGSFRKRMSKLEQYPEKKMPKLERISEKNAWRISLCYAIKEVV